MTTTLSAPRSIESWLGEEAENLLTYKAKVSQEFLHLPGADFVDRIFAMSDRNPQVLRSLQQLYSTGRLANTGYLSILPVDQGIEHSGAASFAPNPLYFDPEKIIKYEAVAKATGKKYGRTDERVYSELTTDHPIDLTRYQVLNCYAGRSGLINSGGASGKNDFAEAVRTAVINKRAGGCGLISGRKTFQRPLEEGVKLFHSIQDVYLSPEVTIA